MRAGDWVTIRLIQVHFYDVIIASIFAKKEIFMFWRIRNDEIIEIWKTYCEIWNTSVRDYSNMPELKWNSDSIGMNKDIIKLG